MTRESAIERVKKLLALYRDEHATLNERETALALAQRLVDKFKIREEEVAVVSPPVTPPPRSSAVTNVELRRMAEEVASQVLSEATGRVLSAVMDLNSETRRKEWVDKIMKGLFNE